MHRRTITTAILLALITQPAPAVKFEPIKIDGRTIYSNIPKDCIRDGLLICHQFSFISLGQVVSVPRSGPNKSTFANSPPALQGQNLKERDYQEAWCNAANGIVEHRLPDQTRVDCLTETHAIEFDFSHKWAESLGQALHYANQTGKKAGIVLILREPKDQKHLSTLRGNLEQLTQEIDLWCTGAGCPES